MQRRGQHAEGKDLWELDRGRGLRAVSERQYVTGPDRHGRELFVGVCPGTDEVLAACGNSDAVQRRAFGEGPETHDSYPRCQRSSPSRGPSASRPSGDTYPSR